MRVITPEIAWHNKDPIYSLDFFLVLNSFCRLATAGADKIVRIWHIYEKRGDINIEFRADLKKHSLAVNAVRWSLDGILLASADNEGVILIWKLNEIEAKNAPRLFDEDEDEGVEKWTIYKMLRGHLDDVADLSWSSDSKYLASGSVDNSCIVWNIEKGEKLFILKEAKSYIQGVAFDPRRQFIATLGADRNMRVYRWQKNKCTCVQTTSKLPPSKDKDPAEKPKKAIRLFHDDTYISFARRMTFTPDAQLLIVPSGCIESENDSLDCVYTTFIFSRNDFLRPVCHLPGPGKATVAVRCCPTLFQLRERSPELTNLFDLPYRIVFAVASEDSVYLYDTQQMTPFGIVAGIHYERLTDLAWANDGSLLAVSSIDGFCSLVIFASNELGIPYSGDIPASAKEETQQTDKENRIDVEESIQRTVQLVLNDIVNNVVTFTAKPPSVIPLSSSSSSPPPASAASVSAANARKRRINFVTLS